MHRKLLPVLLALATLVSTLPLASNTADATPSPRKVATAKGRLPACRDGKDNDRDGFTDYPSDPDCRSRRGRREKGSAVPTPTATPPFTPPSSEIELGENVSLCGARPFPDDNAWNMDISAEPVDPNSRNLIASIGENTGLHPDFGTFWDGAPIGIPYVVVGKDQAKSAVTFTYNDESDAGPYPIPANPPIEGGENSSGDRHIIMIDRDSWKLYELFDAHLSGTKWTAGSGAVFDLNSNNLRPAGWTSADAAGLPIFPGLARYDEVVEAGEIRHALRFTARLTRRAYVHPARHFASSSSDPNRPPMGMRVRLKSDFDTSSFPAEAQVILRALKKYGMILADNGSDWFISGAPDPRWDDSALATLRRVTGSDFEVVRMGEISQ
jgi:hypothetical protein